MIDKLEAVAEDRLLLEKAAKAAGYDVRWHENWQCFVHVGPFNITSPPTMAGQRMVWVPLDDDGDALRLAVKLQGYGFSFTDVAWAIIEAQRSGADPYAATRRAIVRAALAALKETQ